MNDQDHKKQVLGELGLKSTVGNASYSKISEATQAAESEGVNWLHLALNHLDDQLVAITALGEFASFLFKNGVSH